MFYSGVEAQCRTPFQIWQNLWAGADWGKYDDGDDDDADSDDGECDYDDDDYDDYDDTKDGKLGHQKKSQMLAIKEMWWYQWVYVNIWQWI